MYRLAGVIFWKGLYFATMSAGSLLGFEANVSMARSGELPVGLQEEPVRRYANNGVKTGHSGQGIVSRDASGQTMMHLNTIKVGHGHKKGK